MSHNVRLYPWYQFFRNLTFWQAIWFLYFQQELSAAEAILLYAIFDIATTVMEVPSGYLSDRVGRRFTLILSALAMTGGMGLIVLGESFLVFAAAQVLIGAGSAFASGTDGALLYESLARDGRDDEIERHEIRAWRFSFTALALSAVIGGLMAGLNAVLPFLSSGVAGLVVLGIVLKFREPERSKDAVPGQSGWLASAEHKTAIRILAWIFALSVAMYVFSHVPFVFGQPFILEALRGAGLAADAPLVSGAITAAMMVVSIATSWLAPGLRKALGLVPLLLLAFSIQIGLIAVLTVSESAIAVAFLMLRMVPNSLARPFIMACIQPLLSDHRRATYLSMQSFTGRLLFAGTLILFSSDASQQSTMAFAEIRSILIWYVGAGVAVLAGLILFGRALRGASGSN